MPQTHDTLPLQIKLTPMQLPESRYQPINAPHDGASMAFGSQTESEKRKNCELVIYPGEPSELVVQLENLTNQTLSIDWLLDGTFPQNWCRVHGEGHQIAPRANMELVLYFQVAADYFESPDYWEVRKPLSLDFQGQLTFHCQNVNPDNNDSEMSVARRQYYQNTEFSVFLRPRSLYLQFLPDLYREVDLIGRLLKIFEMAFEPDFNTLLSLWAYLDPLTAPDAMLPFLSHWVGWELTPSLSLQKQRRLISRAMDLYRWRGTRRGLRQYLHLYTDLPLDEELPEEEKHIAIQELGGKGFIIGETEVGDEALIGAGQPYHFIVQLRYPALQPIDKELIRQVIDQEKPAFCTYDLYFVEDNG